MNFASVRAKFLNRTTALVLVVIIALTLLYRPTFQTIINGSSHLMMIDVGETQAVLNTWGTLHPTGYPLYVMVGNGLVAMLKMIGVSAATAPALVSWFWGVLALILVYLLATHLTSKTSGIVLAAALTFVLGLTRFVWVHNVVAEVYSFTFLLQISVLLLALWRQPIRHRVLWLALLGGIGVFHHRTIILLAPALLFAAWPDLKPLLRKPPTLILALMLGLIGFLPYLYLPLRASTDASWVYGEPNHWSNFWDQFNATEAGHFFGWPTSTDAFVQNWKKINDLMLHELGWPAILLGLVGLTVALHKPNFRRPAITLWLALSVNYAFAVTLYTDILASIIIAMSLALAFGWLFLLNVIYDVLSEMGSHPRRRQILKFTLYAVLIYYCTWLYNQNDDFIHGITHDQTGLDTIALAENAPPGSTLMLAWGPRYYAIGFAQEVDHQLTHIRRADHKADFAALIQQGPLVTPEYTFFNQPIAWWESYFGTKVYLRAVAPFLVQIDTAPRLAESPITLPADFDAPIPVIALNAQITCTSNYIVLTVDWAALQTPSRNLAIMVHLLNADGGVIDQADQSAPIYGWRPMTDWLPNEIVTDVYPLPRRSDGHSVRFGLYEAISADTYQNYNIQILPVPCEQ